MKPENLNSALDAVIKKVDWSPLDASIVQADVQRPNPTGEGKGGRSKHDRDATRTKKHGKSYFGYKMHVGVDQDSGLIRSQVFTPAHVHDSQCFDRLIFGDEDMGYADKAYDSAKNAAHHLSRIRSRVEIVFGTLKRSYGYRRVRYRSLVKNTLQFIFLCMCYNLKKMVA